MGTPERTKKRPLVGEVGDLCENAATRNREREREAVSRRERRMEDGEGQRLVLEIIVGKDNGKDIMNGLKATGHTFSPLNIMKVMKWNCYC